MTTLISTAPPPNPPSSFPSVAATTSVNDAFPSYLASSISSIHSDILRSHILTRLDGLTLASVTCTSNELHSLSAEEDLWTDICRSTWPSTNTPRMREVISRFPYGSRSFFSHSFPHLLSSEGSNTFPPHDHDHPLELISAVDIFYRDSLVFSKVAETETESSWFRFSPFRVDMMEPKDTCQTSIPRPESIPMFQELIEDLRLSWILVDPVRPRAMNVSGQKPVSVEKHWLSDEVYARFVVVLEGRRGSSSELVQCGIVVTCGGKVQGRGMHVRGVTLQVEDLDGAFLNGKESLGIVHSAFECKAKRGISGRRKDGEGNRRKYEEFLEMRRERKERKLRLEEALDRICVGFAVFLISTIGLYLLCR